MENNILNKLVNNNMIKSYSYYVVDCDGNDGLSTDKGRNTETLIIEFNDGTKLKLDTFCSGSSEDTCFNIYGII